MMIGTLASILFLTGLGLIVWASYHYDWRLSMSILGAILVIGGYLLGIRHEGKVKDD